MSVSYTLVQRHKSRGIKTWYIRTCTNGRESFKSTKTTKKVEAMKVFSEYVNNRNKSDVNLSDLFIRDCVSEFLAIKKNSVNNETTLINYEKSCKAFIQYCDKNNLQTMGQITTKVAQEYANTLSSYMRPTSVSCRLQVAGAIFNETINLYDLAARNPFGRVKKPRIETKLADFWTMDQVECIISNALNKYYAALWGLMAYAGMRFTEARRLRVENAMGGKITIKNGKGGRDAIVPVSQKLQDLLDDAIDGRTSGSIFDNRIAIRNDKSIEQIKASIARSGRDDFGAIYNHKFRHSFASELLRKGVSVKTTQVLGRWRRADVMLKHYAGVLDDDLKSAVEML